jgi:uncharacterized protein (DUF58 family)
VPELIDYKKYLDPALVSKLKSLDLKAKAVVEGFMVGLHKSPYHGFSVEFTQHRSYQQGDPIKDIDWKVYGKSEKFFIKQYEEETNLICHILLDNSKSMNFKNKSNVSKLEYSQVLSASLIYLLLQQQDSVGLTLYSDRIENYTPPKSNKIHLKTLLTSIAKSKSSNKTNTSECLVKAIENIKRRGLVILISDFFDDIEQTLTALKKIHYKKNEIILFQVLDPIELSFAFGRDAVFKDLETDEELTSQPFHIQKAYREAFNEFLNKIKNECLRYNIDYNLVLTTDNYDKALMNFYKKRVKLN